MHKNFSPLIISGPSGIGKSYLEKILCDQHQCQRIISTTTRPPRPNEKHGQDYNFVSEAQYLTLLQNNHFITSIYNLNAWYGFEKSQVEKIQSFGKTPITICVPQIIAQFIANYPNTKAVFLMPHSLKFLESRMTKRGDSQEKIQERLHYAQTEISFYQQHATQHYHHQILIDSDDLTTPLGTILSLID